MLVEHLTLGRTSAIRYTTDIKDSTKRYFSAVDFEYSSKLLTIPDFPFRIKITAVEEGAEFDLQVGDEPVVSNMCCFEGKNSGLVLENVHQFAETYKKYGLDVEVLDPVSPYWIYSMIIHPMALTKENLQISGEVELYVYERLYQGWYMKYKA